jgi:hypothetical protein
MYECGTLKPVEVISRRGVGEEREYGGNEPNQGVYIYIYINVTMKPLYNYHILIKTFKNC